MRSMSATEVPPNFMTSRAIGGDASPRTLGFAGAFPLERRCKKARIHTGEVGRLQPQPLVNHPRAAMAEKPNRQANPTTVDPDEVERFSALAADWWDPRGKMAPLHKFNPVRIGYIRDQAALRFGRD